MPPSRSAVPTMVFWHEGCDGAIVRSSKLCTGSCYRFDPVGEDFAVKWCICLAGKMCRMTRDTGTSRNCIKVPAWPDRRRQFERKEKTGVRVHLTATWEIDDRGKIDSDPNFSPQF